MLQKFDSCFYGFVAPQLVEKLWGHERQIVNDSLGYCGKRLLVNPQAVSSIHFHRSKTETFFCSEGILRVAVFERNFDFDEKLGGIRCHVLLSTKEEPPEAFRKVPTLYTLTPGCALRIPAFFAHAFWNTSLTPAVFFEFSTNDDPNDSYRLKLSLAKFEGPMPDLTF